MNKNTLYHHGIKGQRWGVRNGPPYPLGASARSTSEKKADHTDHKRSLDKGSKKRYNKNKYGMDLTTQEYLIKAGIMAVGFAIPLLSKTPDVIRSMERKGRIKMAERNNTAMKLKKKTTQLPLAADLKKVNPNYNKSDAYRMNCSHCVIATELRRRGYDVEATGINNTCGEDLPFFKSFFKNIDLHNVQKNKRQSGETISDFQKRSVRDLGSTLEKYGNGARGFIAMNYQCNPSGGGHVLSWEIINGKARFYDGQDGSIDAVPFLEKTIYPNSCHYIRLDNLEIRPQILDEVVKNID